MKALNYLVEAVQATEFILLDVQHKFRKQVYNLISTTSFPIKNISAI